MVHLTRADALAFAVTDDEDIFANPTFQLVTGLKKAPVGSYSSYSDKHYLGNLKSQVKTDIREYLTAWGNTAYAIESKKLALCRSATDDKPGKAPWKELVRKIWPDLQLASKFQEVARAEGVTPWSIAAMLPKAAPKDVYYIHALFFPHCLSADFPYRNYPPSVKSTLEPPKAGSLFYSAAKTQTTQDALSRLQALCS